MEFGVQCATIVSPTLTLKLFAVNSDIPLQMPEPTVVSSTDQEEGEYGWTMFVVLAMNPAFILVTIVAGGFKTVHTVKM